MTNRFNFSFITFTSQYAERKVHIDSSPVTDKFIITPILSALIGVGVALSFVTITILIMVCCKTKRTSRNEERQSTETSLSWRSLSSWPQTLFQLSQKMRTTQTMADLLQSALITG